MYLQLYVLLFNAGAVCKLSTLRRSKARQNVTFRLGSDFHDLVLQYQQLRMAQGVNSSTEAAGGCSGRRPVTSSRARRRA